jgi:hypothetical protein
VASGLRKATVLKQDLPPVIKLDTNEYGYLARYRVVSEDRNRFSAWSPVSTVSAFNLSNLPGVVDGDIAMMGNSIFIVWGDELNRPRYDVFVSFDGEDYFYHGTSPIHTYSIINNVNAASVDVAIQIESINKERSDVLTICELSGIIES